MDPGVTRTKMTFTGEVRLVSIVYKNNFLKPGITMENHKKGVTL